MARVVLTVLLIGALAAGMGERARADGEGVGPVTGVEQRALGPRADLGLTDAEREWLALGHRVVVALGPHPPYVWLSPEGEASGIAVDYLKEIAARSGVDFVLERRLVDYVDALDSMARCEGPDMMPCTSSASGRPLEFSTPYTTTEYVIFTQVSSPFVGGLDGLRGRRVSALPGTVLRLERLMPGSGTEFFPAEHDFDGLRAVATGQVDAFVGELIIGSHEIQKMGLANIRVAAPTPLPARTFSFGVRPDWPELRGIIDKALASMTHGEHAAIRTAHVGIRYEHGIGPAHVLRWVGAAVGGGLALVLLALLWNRQLARRVRIRTTELTAASERLRSLASELTVAEERERRRLAADLHDQVGQPLALARVQLAAKFGKEGHATSPRDIEDVSETLLLASQETRRLISDLSTPSMGPLGLAAAISDWMDDRLARSVGLSMDIVDECDPGSVEALDESVRAILFRNARELLINVIKHAHASRVVVRLSNDADTIRIRIEDDGVGFDPGALNGKASDGGGFGLFSITERMADLGGTARILSHPGGGCAVELELPFHRPSERAEAGGTRAASKPERKAPSVR